MSSDADSGSGSRLGGWGGLTEVWHVGETVRRTGGSWTPALHALLGHLERIGFAGAPRPIGIDKEGREILSFVKGGGPSHTDDALARVAQLVRELHDATESFRAPQDARRQFMVGAPRVGDVVCHNDLSPDNTIYGSDRTPHAFIDWDLEGYPYRYVEIDEFTYWLTSGAGAGDIINRKPTVDAGWDD